MKEYKLWDALLRKVVYSRDVTLSDVRETSNTEEAQMEK
jgi:hypothetical protein